jgi:hypothetical protein
MTDNQTETNKAGVRYRDVTPDTRFTVLTVVPRDEPQYREYYVTSDELPLVLQSIGDPQIAETVVDVSKGVRNEPTEMSNDP